MSKRKVEVLKSCRLRWRLGQLLRITYADGRVTWGVSDDFGVTLYGGDEQRAKADFGSLVPNANTVSLLRRSV